MGYEARLHARCCSSCGSSTRRTSRISRGTPPVRMLRFSDCFGVLSLSCLGSICVCVWLLGEVAHVKLMDADDDNQWVQRAVTDESAAVLLADCLWAALLLEDTRTKGSEGRVCRSATGRLPVGSTLARRHADETGEVVGVEQGEGVQRATARVGPVDAGRQRERETQRTRPSSTSKQHCINWQMSRPT